MTYNPSAAENAGNKSRQKSALAQGKANKCCLRLHLWRLLNRDIKALGSVDQNWDAIGYTRRVLLHDWISICSSVQTCPNNGNTEDAICRAMM